MSKHSNDVIDSQLLSLTTMTNAAETQTNPTQGRHGPRKIRPSSRMEVSYDN